MAQITWRNVEAPDFRGVQGSLNASSQMLQNAATGWDRYERTQQDILNGELNRANVTQQMSQQDYLYQRLRTGNAAMDAAGPALQQLYRAGRTNDQIGIEGALSDEALSQLRPEQFLGAVKNTGDLASTNLVDTSRGIGNAAASNTLEQNIKTQNRGEAVNAAMVNVIDGALSRTDAQTVAARQRGNLDAAGWLALQAGIDQRFPATASGGSVSSPAAAVGQTGTTTLGSYKGAPVSSVLAPALSASEKVAGLPAGLMNSLVMQETGGKEDYIKDPAKYHYEPDASGKRKSTAFGPYGILESTAKNPGFGVAPLKDKSLEEQTRFATEYLAARIKAGGSVQAGLAGYGEGDKYATQVLGRMSGTDAPALSSASSTGADRAANLSADVMMSEQLNSNIVSDYDTALKSNEKTSEVADRLRKGPLVGWSDKQVMDAIEEVRALIPGSNAAVAGAIISTSLTGADSDPFDWTSPRTWLGPLPFVDNKRQIDPAMRDTNIAALVGGATDRNYLTAAQLKEDNALREAASKNADAAAAKLKHYQQEAVNRPALKEFIPALEEELKAANAKYTALITKQRTDENQYSGHTVARNKAAEAARERLRLAAEKAEQPQQRVTTPLAVNGTVAEKAGVGGGFKPGKGSFVEQALGRVANGMLDKIQ